MTYAELQAAIADTLIRQDLTAVIPRFIRHAEETFNRNLRVRQMIVRSTATLDGEDYIALPVDWLQARNIQLNEDPQRRLEYVTLDQADQFRQLATGQTKYYTISGDQIEFVPSPESGTIVEMTYYGKIPALSDSVTTNWLLTDWSDLYLYQSLSHAPMYLKEDERRSFEERAMMLMEEVRLSDVKSQYSGAPLKIRPAASFG